MENIGKKIKELREARDLTQAELASLVRRNPHTIKDYEAGRAKPSLEAISLLAKALGVKESDLLSRDEIEILPQSEGLMFAAEVLSKLSKLSDSNRNLILKQIDKMLEAQEINHRKASKQA